MNEYVVLFKDAFLGYARYLGHEISHPHIKNYVYWLIAISVVVYMLEVFRPWRKEQSRIRRDFWLDAFYMFFNFFLFSLIGYHALSQVVGHAFQQLYEQLGFDPVVILDVSAWSPAAQLIVLFILRDFIHWNVHRLLHRVPLFWQFHKVHHSVREMGFAAHLRYHWMETILYRTLEFIPLALIGFGLREFILVHLFALTIGHLNHANFVLPMGPFKYLFNSAQMHIWHHAKELPPDKPYGINYGISLSCWDYMFGSAVIPHVGRDIELGFAEVETFPKPIWRQWLWPWWKKD